MAVPRPAASGVSALPARWLAILFLAIATASPAAWAQADLVLNHSDNPDPGPAGGIFTYTLRIDNNGPNAATGVTLDNTTPPGSGFIDATPSAGNCPTVPAVGAAGTVSCNLGNLPFTTPATSFVTVVIRVRLRTAGVWTNTATASSAVADPNPANNTNSVNPTTAVDAADLAITAVPSAANVAAGQPFTYTVATTNNGPNMVPADATQQITFTIPIGTSITSAPSGAGWSCTPSGGYPRSTGNITCSRSGPLAAGGTPPALTVPAVANAVGNITAVFATSATKADATAMPDGALANNTVNAGITVSTGSDLAITKTASPTTVAQGANVTYTLVPRFNGGVAPGAGGGLITVTDTLDPNLAFVSASGAGWTCAAAGQVVTCDRVGPYAGGNFTDMGNITVVATANAAGSLSNQVAIAAPEPDPVPGNNADTVNVTSSNDADLRMNKSASINPVVPGQAFNYTLSATNLGPLATAAGQTITIQDTLPANVELTAAPNGTGWTCGPLAGFPIAGAAITCTRTSALGSGNNTPGITVPARLVTAGLSTNTACVGLAGAGRVDNNGGNNCAGVGVNASATAADLELVSKTVSPATLQAGETLTYVITVRNNGPDTSTDVVLTDQLASLMSTGGFRSATPSQGTCTPNGVTNGATVNLSCALGTLPVGAMATVEVVVRPTVATTGNRTNTARVTSTSIGDPVQGNNQNSVTSQVTALVDVTAGKTATPLTVPAGAPITFVATVRNNGPSTAQTVRMVDTLPANAAFIDLVSVSGGGTCTTIPAAGAVGGTLQCEWASMNNGVQQTASYRMRPLGSAVNGTVTNVVNVTTATTESDTTNNSATTSTPVTAAILDILVNKDDGPDPVDLGQLTTYTLTITNSGPSYGTNVVLTDVFPAPGATPTAVFSYLGNLTVNAGGSCTQPALGVTAGTVRCTFPGLSSGQSAVVTYQKRAETLLVPGASTGTAFNSASVTVDETETTLANNEVVEDTTARRNAVATDLQLTKTATPSSAAPGSTLTYVLSVVNNGPMASAGAQVIDNLPAGLGVVTAAGCTVTGSTVTCPVGNLAVGATRSFQLVVQLANPYTGPRPISNTATLDAPGDTNPGNNSSSATTPVIDPNAVEGIPTLSEWAMLILGSLMAAAAAGRLRRRPVGK